MKKKDVSKIEFVKEGKIMKKFLMSTACVLALGVSGAQAQNMDYGSLQELFGEPVTTSANGSPMRASDAPMDMTIISAEDIERFPAREIPDILRHYAGVSVRQNTNTDYSVGLRGYNQPGAERILVLVNGRQVYQDYYGLVNWSAIPVELNEIQQIEIVRGPNTALFGFNATSGVVNIVTKNPLYDDVDLVEADLGINQYGRISGVYTFQNEDKWGLRLSAGGAEMDEDAPSFNPNESNVFVNDAHTRNFNADNVIKLNDSTSMRFEASVSDTNGNGMSAYYDGAEITERFVGLKAGVSSDTDYGIIDATIYRNSADADFSIATGVFGFENDVTVLQLSDTFKVGTDHTFRIAGEYRDNVSALILNGTTLAESSYHIGSVSGLWSWAATPKLSLSTAVRYDHAQADLDGAAGVGGGPIPGNPFTNDQFNNRYDEFGYNFGALYKLTDIDTVRFNVSKGVDMPSIFEMSLQVNAAGTTFFSDPTLEASDVHDFQLGYERKMDYFNGSFKATAFYQRIDEMQGFVASSATSAIIKNVGDSEVYGVEVALDGVTDNNIRWGVNYSYSQVEDDIFTTLDFEKLNSDHMIKGNIGYSPNEQWDFDAFAAYESDFDSARDFNGSNVNYGVDPDVILDTRIAYKPTDKWTVSLNGQALFGENEQSSYAEETDTQLFLRAKYDF